MRPVIQGKKMKRVLPVVRKEYDEYKQLKAQNKLMLKALTHVILSQDCEWENKNMGHDWREAMREVREAIKAGGCENDF